MKAASVPLRVSAFYGQRQLPLIGPCGVAHSSNRSNTCCSSSSCSCVAIVATQRIGRLAAWACAASVGKPLTGRPGAGASAREAEAATAATVATYTTPATRTCDAAGSRHVFPVDCFKTNSLRYYVGAAAAAAPASATAPCTPRANTAPVIVTPITPQHRQHGKKQALRLLQQQQLNRVLYRPQCLEAFAAAPGSDEAASFVVATAAAGSTIEATTVATSAAEEAAEGTAAAAATTATAAATQRNNGEGIAARIRHAYLRGDWRCLAAAAEESLLLLEQPVQQQAPPYSGKHLAAGLMLLSLLRPPQRDEQVQRLLAAVGVALQQLHHHQQQQFPFTPGECATLVAALGNFGLSSVSHILLSCLADEPLESSTAAVLSSLFVSVYRQHLLEPANGAADAAAAASVFPSEKSSILLRRMLQCQSLSPAQTCSVLQAAAYAAFFPKGVAVLLVPAPPAAATPDSGAAAGAATQAAVATAAAVATTGKMGGDGISSPAPVHIETHPGSVEAADTPEVLGLAAAITAAIEKVTVALKKSCSSTNSMEMLPLDSMFRLTEALVLRDISLSVQLNSLAMQQQLQQQEQQPQHLHQEGQEQQQVQEFYRTYRQELDALVLLLLDALLQQQHLWGICTPQEMLFFFLALLRLFGIGNPERLALAAALSSQQQPQQQQQQQQYMWQLQEQEHLAETVYEGIRRLWLHVSQTSNNTGSGDSNSNSSSNRSSPVEAALRLRVLSLLCSSSKTYGIVPSCPAPYGVAAAAAAASPGAASFGAGMQQWGQELLLQWQLTAAANFTPLPAVVVQQQQRSDAYLFLKQQQERTAQQQAKVAALLLGPGASAAGTSAPGAAAAAGSGGSRLAAEAQSAPAAALAVPASPVLSVLQAATDSVFHFSSSVSSVALLLLRSFIELNSLQHQLDAPLAAQKQHAEAWELLLTCSREELQPQQQGTTWRAAAAAFRASAFLHLYRSLQRQRRGLRSKLLLLQQREQQKDNEQQLLQQQLRQQLRQLRQSMHSLRLQQLSLLDFLLKQQQKERPLKETAAVLVMLAGASLLRPCHLALLTPSLLEGLHANLQHQHQQQETTAAVISLLTLRCLLPTGSLSEELLSSVLHAAVALVDVLQPREVAVCLYSLRPQPQEQHQHSQVLRQLQQTLKGKLLQRGTLLLPSFPPEELLLFIASVGDGQLELLQQAFGCMYTAIPFYTPQQLATAFVLYSGSGLKDSSLRLRLLLQLLAFASSLPARPVCAVAEALTSTATLSQPSADTAAPAADVGTTQAELQRKWEQQLTDALFARAAACLPATVGRLGPAAATTSTVAAKLLCCSFSLPVCGEQQQMLKNILMMQVQHQKTQLQRSKSQQQQAEQQQQQQNKLRKSVEPLPCRKSIRLLGLLEPELLLQLLLLQLRQQHNHQHQQAQQQPAIDFAFFGATCGAIKGRLQELSTEGLLRLLSGLHAAGVPPRNKNETATATLLPEGHVKGFVPHRFCRKLGSILKERIESFNIPMRVVAAHALALHSLGVWGRLSPKTQAAILSRLEDEERNKLPLPPAMERKQLQGRTIRQLRIKNLAVARPKERTPGAPSLLILAATAKEADPRASLSKESNKRAIDLFKEVVARS